MAQNDITLPQLQQYEEGNIVDVIFISMWAYSIM